MINSIIFLAFSEAYIFFYIINEIHWDSYSCFKHKLVLVQVFELLVFYCLSTEIVWCCIWLYLSMIVFMRCLIILGAYANLRFNWARQFFPIFLVWDVYPYLSSWNVDFRLFHWVQENRLDPLKDMHLSCSCRISVSPLSKRLRERLISSYFIVLL